MKTITILLVDNDEEFLTVRTVLLQNAGYTVIACHNAQEARQKLEQDGIDLAIIDSRLVDDDDHLDVSGYILADEIPESLPKIILTVSEIDVLLLRKANPYLISLSDSARHIRKDEHASRFLELIEYSLMPPAPPPPLNKWESKRNEDGLTGWLSIQKDKAPSFWEKSHFVGRTQPAGEEISFTSYHPKEGSVEYWHTLLVYTHLTSVLKKVQNDAKRFSDLIKSPRETIVKSSILVFRGYELSVVPSCEGVTFNPERVSFKWHEDFHRQEFRFKADKSLSGDAARGQISIYLGPLVIGTLKFAMLFSEGEEENRSVPDHEEHAKLYGKDDVFISYSRKDTEIARTFKTILSATGMDVFLDVDSLRSGQEWQPELLRRIENAKIFQMFWSENYSQSENCRMEWQHALKQNKTEGYIRPVFWKKPLLPNPPDELSKFNFQYVELPETTDP